jgi:hypothetical protein
VVGGWWPTDESNFTVEALNELTAFLAASGNTLMLTLNELHGRDCHTPKPDCPTNPGCQEWCRGEWDTSNVREFLQYLHDQQMVGGSNPLQYFELGNELVSHLNYTNNTADVIALADIIKQIWSSNSSAIATADADVDGYMGEASGHGNHYIPPLIAPSTDDCSDPGTAKIMAGIAGHAQGFSFHAYPGGSVSGSNHHPTMLELLTNSTWLRTGILHGSDAIQCVSDFSAVVGTAAPADRMGLWLTESAASWNVSVAAPAQNAFLHNFFTLAELGQYASLPGVPKPTTSMGTTNASTGGARSSGAGRRAGRYAPVEMVARWAFAEASPFATISKNGTRWDVAADYWLIVMYKRLIGGTRVLAVSGDEAGEALVYA